MEHGHQASFHQPSVYTHTHPVDVDGREHVLKHSGHDFDVHALSAKVIEHQKWVVGELLLMHPVSLQR